MSKFNHKSAMVKYKWLGKTRSNFRVKIKQRQMTVGYEFAGHSKTLKNSTTFLNIVDYFTKYIFLSTYLFYSARNILMGSYNKVHFILLSNIWQQEINDWIKTNRHHWTISKSPLRVFQWFKIYFDWRYLPMWVCNT